jgi:hydroxymethylbilane synthase
MSLHLVYATRKSMLALAQARALIADVARLSPGLTTGELQVVTTGDQIQDRPLSEVGGKGLFVKEIEEAILEGRAHCAVHSLKDVPASLPDGLGLVAVPKREYPQDALVSNSALSIAALPERARVGTSSLRRALTLKRLRPDIQILPLRGNVDTRLRKLDDGDYDAIVLAASGLRRLGYGARIAALLPVEQFLPAIGQGALAIEARSTDAEVRAVLEKVHDAETAVAVATERGIMRALGGDCKTPIAAYAVRDGVHMHVRAWVSDHDGSALRSREAHVLWPTMETEAFSQGEAFAQSLLAQSPD